jgi:hypothetical protein
MTLVERCIKRERRFICSWVLATMVGAPAISKLDGTLFSNTLMWLSLQPRDDFRQRCFELPRLVLGNRILIMAKTVQKAPSFVTPFGNDLYGMCGGELCKLSDHGFQTAKPEDQKAFGGLAHLNRAGTSAEQRDGWMIKRIGNLPNQQFEVDIAGKLKFIARNDAKNEREAAKVLIDLVRPDQSKENLYKADGSARWVTRAEYNRDFPWLEHE